MLKRCRHEPAQPAEQENRVTRQTETSSTQTGTTHRQLRYVFKKLDRNMYPDLGCGPSRCPRGREVNIRPRASPVPAGTAESLSSGCASRAGSLTARRRREDRGCRRAQVDPRDPAGRPGQEDPGSRGRLEAHRCRASLGGQGHLAIQGHPFDLQITNETRMVHCFFSISKNVTRVVTHLGCSHIEFQCHQE